MSLSAYWLPFILSCQSIFSSYAIYLPVSFLACSSVAHFLLTGCLSVHLPVPPITFLSFAVYRLLVRLVNLIFLPTVYGCLSPLLVSLLSLVNRLPFSCVSFFLSYLLTTSAYLSHLLDYLLSPPHYWLSISPLLHLSVSLPSLCRITRPLFVISSLLRLSVSLASLSISLITSPSFPIYFTLAVLLPNSFACFFLSCYSPIICYPSHP